MSDRRTFIKEAGSTLIGSLLFSRYPLRIKSSYDLGVQLFTLMSVIDQDTKGTLEKVAALGYKNIESAFSRQGGFYGQSAKEFAALTADLGLNWQAHHVIGAPFKLPPGTKMPTDENGNALKLPPMLNLKENRQQLVDDAAEGGIKYLVCANIPANTPEEIDDTIEILTQTGDLCKKAGLQLVYHNHDWEFKVVGNSTPYEAFLSQIPGELLKMELDLAWAIKAGIDPVDLFKEHPGRFPLWHVKDIAEDMLTLKPVGQGSIDFSKIFANAETAGLVYPFVEHDMPADGIKSLQVSIEYLRDKILRN